MHKPTVLVSCFHGYVARCEGCAKLQIAFGTSFFEITKIEFEKFIQSLYTLRVKGDAYGLHEKSIRIGGYAQMILTPYELENLIELVESASIKNLVHECLANRN